MNPQVGIIMGSDSDLAVMQAAADIIKEFGISFELTVVSAHRTPLRMVEYAQYGKKKGTESNYCRRRRRRSSARHGSFYYIFAGHWGAYQVFQLNRWMGFSFIYLADAQRYSGSYRSFKWSKKCGHPCCFNPWCF